MLGDKILSWIDLRLIFGLQLNLVSVNIYMFHWGENVFFMHTAVVVI